jgi:hypothetical protein
VLVGGFLEELGLSKDIKIIFPFAIYKHSFSNTIFLLWGGVHEILHHHTTALIIEIYL